MWFKKSQRNFIYFTTFTLSAIAIITLQDNRYQKVANEIANPDYLQQEKELQTALNIRRVIPSFGFNNLYADSIYLDFVQYFGDETARKATGYSLTPEYFSAIAERDARFTDAYLTLATANSMYAGKAEQTVELMNKILQQNSSQTKDIHLLWTTKAMDEVLFLGDINAAKKSHQKAAKIGKKYPESANKNFNLQQIQFLATNPNPTEAQITAWKSVLPHVVKKSEQQAIRDRIKELEAKLN